MSNPQNEPGKPRAPKPETPNYVTGSSREQVLFYVTVTATAIALLVVLFYAFAS